MPAEVSLGSAAGGCSSGSAGELLLLLVVVEEPKLVACATQACKSHGGPGFKEWDVEMYIVL
jgi:hypothetical protein